MGKRFLLTLTIEGENLAEIDDQLIAAGGQRLMARMTAAPKVNGQPLTTVVTETITEIPEAPDPNGRPDRPAAVREPAITALRAIHRQFGDKGVRECLAKFNIGLARELPIEKIGEFVGFCSAMLKDPDAPLEKAE